MQHWYTKLILLPTLLLGQIFSCQQQTTQPPLATIPAEAFTNTNNVLKVAYIGNMGVLLESDTQTVIIDGLHDFYKPDYSYPSSATISQLIEATYPGFTAIEAALVTHHHGDHFDSAYSYDFLSGNPTSLLLGAHQVVQDVNTLSANNVKDQIRIINYDRRVDEVTHKDIIIKAIRCDHVNPARHSSIQNIAYLIELGTYKILHIGDTNWSQMKDSLSPLALTKQELDLAIIPYWMLLDESASQLLENQLSARNVIATHLPPNYAESDKKQLEEKYANTTLFTEQGMVLKINHN